MRPTSDYNDAILKSEANQLNDPKVTYMGQQPFSQMHSRDNSLGAYQNGQQQHLKSSENDASSFAKNTFQLEPRDESLMRKNKVLGILKTFQEQDSSEVLVKKRQNNFGEQFNQIDNKQQKDILISHAPIEQQSQLYLYPKPVGNNKKKSLSSVPLQIECSKRELQTYCNNSSQRQNEQQKNQQMILN